ncbi:hypothetical protein GGF44_004764, partial [Coemansia sp. RSA 1694]
MSAVEYLHPTIQSNKLARMQIGPLVRELADNVVSAVEADRGVLASKQQQQPKMSIYSGHDTTVGPLLAILGDELGGSPSLNAFAGPMWPPFASSLRFELLKDSTSPYPTVQPAWAGDLADHSDDLSTIPPEERIRPLNVPDSLYRWAPGQTAAAPAVPFNPRATRDYYVRVWYNDRSVQLPACLDPGAHHSKLGSTVCTLDGFFKQIARFVPSDDEVIQERRALAESQKSQVLAARARLLPAFACWNRGMHATSKRSGHFSNRISELVRDSSAKSSDPLTKPDESAAGLTGLLRMGRARRQGGYDRGAGMHLSMPLRAKNVEKAWDICTQKLQRDEYLVSGDTLKSEAVELVLLMAKSMSARALSPAGASAEDNPAADKKRRALFGFRSALILKHVFADSLCAPSDEHADLEAAAESEGEIDIRT